MAKVLLEITDLKVYYTRKVQGKRFFKEKKHVKAVDGINFSVNEGETFGLVGESGCGKSTTGKAIVKLLTPTEGMIKFDGQDVFTLHGIEDKGYKRKAQIIFQDPYSSLDPRFTVERIVGEPLVIHGMKSKKERREVVKKLLDDVGILPEYIRRHPHEFSGGQRQRIGVARALALNPSLVVCDEPVSALDVSIQAQILNLMKDLQEKYKLTYIFISHNLSVVKHVSDRIAVMYLGHIVEMANTEDIFSNPLHPYTKALLDAVPEPDPDFVTDETPLQGDVPSPLNPPVGCCFHTRCPVAMEECSKVKPEMKEYEPGHTAACHLL